jgi:hypothetical protein
MKTLLTLTLVLAIVAVGSVSWASTNLNLLASRHVLRNNVVNPTTAATKTVTGDRLSNGANLPPPTITICKKTIPAGGTGFPFSWTNGAGALPSFSLNDTQCSIKNLTAMDHYNKFTENVPAGWVLTNISCNQTTSPVKIIGANANPAFQLGDNTVTIDLNETNVTCTFINQRQPRCCGWGFDLSTVQGNGSIDPLWKLNNGNAYIISNLANLSGVWMPLPLARWIQPGASLTPIDANAGTYKYTLVFTIPSCRWSHVQLSGSFAADNSAMAYLDGIPIPGASCAGPTCFNSTQAPVSLNGAPAITAGSHTLEIDVKNDPPTATYSGLIVNARLTRTCP